MALRWRVALLAASVGLGFGCAEPPLPVVHDLAALFPQAMVLSGTVELDLGAPGARPHLVEGWSADETAADGASFVWAVGSRSSIEFVASGSAPDALLFRAWPFHFENAPAQTVGLRVNGLDVGEVALAPSAAEYRVALPEEAVIAGTNRLELTYAYRRAPSAVLTGANDARPLAVGWDWIRFEGAASPEAPRVSGEGEAASLVLPEGASLVYYLDVSRDGAFVLEERRALGEVPPALLVDAETLEDRREQRLEGEARASKTLLPPAGGLVRLQLTAASGGIVLRRPTVRGRVAEPPPAPELPVARPDVVLVVIDTLRADHLGCYGYRAGTSPTIDALAEEAVLFENAVAQSSWTRPSVASMMTGLSPEAHLTNGRDDALPPGIPTLAERLGALGYETVGLVTNTNVAAPFGFARGFDSYELLVDEDPRLGYARANELVDRALALLEEREEGARPLFLYLHANDPHDPYSFSERSGDGLGTMTFMKALESGAIDHEATLVEELVGLYDEEVRFVDAELGRFFDGLQEYELYEDALIVLLSDHGEEFYEHGWWRHGKTLYGEQLHVPLLVKWPGGEGAGSRVGARARHIDLLPTFLDVAGAPPERELPGRSLWPLVSSAEEARAAVDVAESYLRLDGRELECVYLGDWKLVRYYTYDRERPSHEIFDLGADASESENLAGERPRELRFLEGLLRRPVAGPDVHRTPAVISEETERRLRALGYMR